MSQFVLQTIGNSQTVPLKVQHYTY